MRTADVLARRTWSSRRTTIPFDRVVMSRACSLLRPVVATGEVKSRLTTNELPDVVRKGASIKALRKRGLAGSLVFANESYRVRWVDGPPSFFAFVFESVVSPQTLMARLGDSKDTPVDAVFILGEGAAVNFGDGQGSFRLGLADGSDVTGWAWMRGEPTLLQMLA